MMDLHSIWTQKKEHCSAPTVLQRQAKAATWMPGRCLRCGTSALWRTKDSLLPNTPIGSLNKLSAVAEQYALHHLDKPLKSYSFLKSVLP